MITADQARKIIAAGEADGATRHPAFAAPYRARSSTGPSAARDRTPRQENRRARECGRSMTDLEA